MDLQLTIDERQGLTVQLYRQLRAAIVEGRLAAGQRLPSTRELASQLAVSRKTTLEVYEKLEAEGFLAGHGAKGSFVGRGLASSAGRRPVSIDIVPASVWRSVPEALAMPRAGADLRLDFRGGVVDRRIIDFAAWRRAIAHAVRLQARMPGTYRDPAGEQELRLAISRYVGMQRAVACQWNDVLVTAGAQHAINLIARVMVEPGDTVAVEDPGYPPASQAMRTLGARVVPVPVDGQGMIVDAIPADARVIYVTPSHQFPLGMPMSLERRVALVEAAARRGAVVIEDDYDGEFRFDGRPVESLKSLDHAGVVIYVGSFSKTMFPDLRVGYAIAPPSLMPVLLKARQLEDWHGCTLTQLALGRFMLEGDFARHLRRAQRIYARRREALLGWIGGALAPWMEVVPSSSGIHLTALLRGTSEAGMVAHAARLGIGLHGIAPFHAGGQGPGGLLFGYAGMDVDDINAAMSALVSELGSQ
ncbi:PLP-dependent aminotransferase family protein [Pinirhizobacter soli]|uniref:MocR-like pyridoxine biosynthesis transcription factor PdxR n=1 Tax=Pinirhizobacter soli TaxID=2786953 RepID=UPI002029BF21